MKIAQTLLRIFENPAKEEQQVLEILINLQEQNANEAEYWLIFD
ncbi:hypothetical protein [uncultured Helicobacter sp.]|nr:hypothetical protein [uncultured Helicobacter sp.]